MKVKLVANIIVNDGHRGVPRKAGDVVEVRSTEAGLLIANGQAEPVGAAQQKGGN